MADEHEQEQTDPIESLLDLLVYAPLGLVTQLDELLPGLVERGRSQAVMARTIGEFAVRAGSQKLQGTAGDAQKQLETVLRSLLELAGSRLGGGTAASSSASKDTSAGDTAPLEPDPAAAPVATGLPIADYDDLRAAEIVPMLASLDPAQRATIAAHESANRSRRTILNRIEQLGADPRP